MITRSIGTCVHGYIVGGGYEGQTKELDNIVKNEAELLQQYFNKDVEIRFNSNRQSGGAWIKDGNKNCSIGLSARLTNSELFNMNSESKCKLAYQELKHFMDNPDIIIFETAISLKDTINSVENNSPYMLLGSEYRDFYSIEEAYNYLINNVTEII